MRRTQLPFIRIWILAILGMVGLIFSACAPPPEMIATLTQLPLTPTRTPPSRAPTPTFEIFTRPPGEVRRTTRTPIPPGFVMEDNDQTLPAPDWAQPTLPADAPDLPQLDEATGQVNIGGAVVFDARQDAPGCEVHGLFFSPDLERFLVVPACPDGLNPGFVLNSDGSQKQGVHEPDDYILEGNFDWSSESDRIIYLSAGADRILGLIVYNVTNQTKSLIVNAGSLSGATPLQPRWSPDNQWIAFLIARPDGTADVALIRPDGTEQQLFDTLTSVDPRNRLEWQPAGDGYIELRYLTPDGETLRTYPISSGP